MYKSSTGFDLLRVKHVDWFNIINILFFGFVGLIMLFPLWSVVAISISDAKTLAEASFVLFPKKIDFSSYIYITNVPYIANSFFVTIRVAVVGTAINMLVTFTYAYAISLPDLPFKKFFVNFAIIPMFFSGGLIPLYMTIKNYGLRDTMWTMILPLAVNVWYLMVIKNHFVDMPQSVRESAMIDGANELVIFAKIMLPMSKAIIATFLLFYAVDRWNEWFYSSIFTDSGSNFTLQKVLRDVLMNELATGGIAATSFRNSTRVYVDSQSIKMATTVVAVLPIALLYPILQKYFVKGITAGAVKG